MLYSLDSNAVSDIQRNSHNVRQQMENELIKGNEIAICDIVYYEILRGLKAVGATTKIKDFLKMCDEFVYLPLNKKAIERAADIYVSLHRGLTVEDNDIYIAAIAIANDCTLVTANEKHFSRIEGLNFVNWRKTN